MIFAPRAATFSPNLSAAASGVMFTSLARLTPQRSAGRGSCLALPCGRTSCLLLTTTILTLRRFGPKRSTPRHLVFLQGHSLLRGSVSWDNSTKVRGLVGSQTPFILHVQAQHSSVSHLFDLHSSAPSRFSPAKYLHSDERGSPACLEAVPYPLAKVLVLLVAVCCRHC